MYVNEEGCWPVYREPEDPNGWDIYWCAAMKAGETPDFDRGVISSYLRVGQVQSCPSWNREVSSMKPGLGYGYNWMALGYPPMWAAYISWWCPGWPYNSPARDVEVSRPSETIAFADSAIRDTDDPELITETVATAPTSQDHGYPSMHFRHSERANIVFCDGHVDGADPLSGTEDPYHPLLAHPCADDSLYDRD
jgi:prepilin-type processing-associated H-X9-DG protein